MYEGFPHTATPYEAPTRTVHSPRAAAPRCRGSAVDLVFVLEAVKQNGRALDFAAAELKADREIVLGREAEL